MASHKESDGIKKFSHPLGSISYQQEPLYYCEMVKEYSSVPFADDPMLTMPEEHSLVVELYLQECEKFRERGNPSTQILATAIRDGTKQGSLNGSQHPQRLSKQQEHEQNKSFRRSGAHHGPQQSAHDLKAAKSFVAGGGGALNPPQSRDFAWNDRWQRAMTQPPHVWNQVGHWAENNQVLSQFKSEIESDATSAVKVHLSGGKRHSVSRIRNVFSNVPVPALQGDVALHDTDPPIGGPGNSPYGAGIVLRNDANGRISATQEKTRGGQDGEGSSFTPSESKVFFYVWHSFQECTKFVEGFQQLQQTIFEHNLYGLHVPFTASFVVNGTAVTATPLIPIESVNPVRYQQKSLSKTNILAAIMKRIPRALFAGGIEGALGDELSTHATAYNVPTLDGDKQHLNRLNVYQGVDGRWYLVDLRSLFIPHPLNKLTTVVRPAAFRTMYTSGQGYESDFFLLKILPRRIAISLCREIQAFAGAARKTKDPATGNIFTKDADLTMETLLLRDFVSVVFNRLGGSPILLYQVLVELEGFAGKKLEFAQQPRREETPPQRPISPEEVVNPTDPSHEGWQRISGGRNPGDKKAAQSGASTGKKKLGFKEEDDVVHEYLSSEGSESEGDSEGAVADTPIVFDRKTSGLHNPVALMRKQSKLGKLGAGRQQGSNNFLTGLSDRELEEKKKEQEAKKAKAKKGWGIIRNKLVVTKAQQQQQTEKDGDDEPTKGDDTTTTAGGGDTKIAPSGGMNSKTSGASPKMTKFIAALGMRKKNDKTQNQVEQALLKQLQDEETVDEVDKDFAQAQLLDPTIQDRHEPNITSVSRKWARNLILYELIVRTLEEMLRTELNSRRYTETEKFAALKDRVRVDLVNRFADTLTAALSDEPDTPAARSFMKDFNATLRLKFCAPTTFSILATDLELALLLRVVPSVLGCTYDPKVKRFTGFKTVVMDSTLPTQPETLRRYFLKENPNKIAKSLATDLQLTYASSKSQHSLTRQLALLRLAFQALLLGAKLSKVVSDQLLVELETSAGSGVYSRSDPLGHVFVLAHASQAAGVLNDTKSTQKHLEQLLDAYDELSLDSADFDIIYKSEQQRLVGSLLRALGRDEEATRMVVEATNSVSSMQSRVKPEFSIIHLDRLLEMHELGLEIKKEKYSEVGINEAMRLADITDPPEENRARVSQLLLDLPTNKLVPDTDRFNILKRIATNSVAFHDQYYGKLSAEACSARNLLALFSLKAGEELDPELRGDLLLGLQVLQGQGGALAAEGALIQQPTGDGKINDGNQHPVGGHVSTMLDKNGNPLPPPTGGDSGLIVGPNGEVLHDSNAVDHPQGLNQNLLYNQDQQQRLHDPRYPGQKLNLPTTGKSQALLEAQRLAAHKKNHGNLAYSEIAKLEAAIHTEKAMKKMAKRVQREMTHLAQREQHWEDFCLWFEAMCAEEFALRSFILQAQEEDARYFVIGEAADIFMRFGVESMEEHFAHYLRWTEHGEYIEVIETEDRDKVLLWEQSDLQRVFVREEFLHRKLIKEVEKKTRYAHLLGRLEYLNRRQIVQEEVDARVQRQVEERTIAVIQWNREEQSFRRNWVVPDEENARREIYCYEESVRRRALILKEEKERIYSIRFMNFVSLEYALRGVEYFETVSRSRLFEEFLEGQRPIFCEQKTDYLNRYLYKPHVEMFESVERERIIQLERNHFSLKPLLMEHEQHHRCAVIHDMFNEKLFLTEIYEDFCRTEVMTVEAEARDLVVLEIEKEKKDMGTTSASRKLELNESKKRRDIAQQRLGSLSMIYSGDYAFQLLELIRQEEEEHWLVLKFQMRHVIDSSFVIAKFELQRYESTLAHNIWLEEEKEIETIWRAAETDRRMIINAFKQGMFTSFVERQEQLFRLWITRQWLCNWYSELATNEYTLLLKRQVLFDTAMTWRRLEQLDQDEIWARIKVHHEEREAYAFLSCSTFEAIVRDQIVEDWTQGWARMLIWFDVAVRVEEALVAIDEQEYQHRLGIEARETCISLNFSSFLGSVRSHIQVEERFYRNGLVSWNRHDITFITKRKLLQQTESAQRLQVKKQAEKAQQLLDEEEFDSLKAVHAIEAARAAAEKELEERIRVENLRREQEREALRQDHERKLREVEIQRLQNALSSVEFQEEHRARSVIAVEAQQSIYILQQEAEEESMNLFGFSTISKESMRIKLDADEAAREEKEAKRRAEEAALLAAEAERISSVLSELQFEEEPEARQQIEKQGLELYISGVFAMDEFIAREEMFRGMVLAGRATWCRKNLFLDESAGRWNLVWFWHRAIRLFGVQEEELLARQTLLRWEIRYQEQYRRRIFIKAQEFSQRKFMQEDPIHHFIFVLGAELNYRCHAEIQERDVRASITATATCYGGFFKKMEGLLEKYLTHSMKVVQAMEQGKRILFEKELLVAQPRELLWNCMALPVRYRIENDERAMRQVLMRMTRLAPEEESVRNELHGSQKIEWKALLRKERAWFDCVLKWAESEQEATLQKERAEERREAALAAARSRLPSNAGLKAPVTLNELKTSAARSDRLLAREKEEARREEEQRIGELVKANCRTAKVLPPIRKPGEEQAAKAATVLVQRQQGRSQSPPEARRDLPDPKLRRTATATVLSSSPMARNGPRRRLADVNFSAPLRDDAYDYPSRITGGASAGGVTSPLQHSGTKKPNSIGAATKPTVTSNSTLDELRQSIKADWNSMKGKSSKKQQKGPQLK